MATNPFVTWTPRLTPREDASEAEKTQRRIWHSYMDLFVLVVTGSNSIRAIWLNPTGVLKSLNNLIPLKTWRVACMGLQLPKILCGSGKYEALLSQLSQQDGISLSWAVAKMKNSTDVWLLGCWVLLFSDTSRLGDADSNPLENTHTHTQVALLRWLHRADPDV